MRLIDADAFMLRMMQKYDEVGEYLDDIDLQPTAYDVDKVIEVLKNKQDHHKELAEYERQVGTIVEMKEHEYAIRVLSEAIEIVKRGGV